MAVKEQPHTHAGRERERERRKNLVEAAELLLTLYANEARKYVLVYYNLSALCTCLIIPHLSCFLKKKKNLI